MILFGYLNSLESVPLFVYLVSQLLMEVIFGLSITRNKFSER